MNFKEHKKDFNKRWNITLSDSPEEALNQFKQRILNAFRYIENQLTDESVTCLVANTGGMRVIL